MTSENGPVVPTWTLGDRLRKARESASLTQEHMALELTERLGRRVRHATIAAWERDKNQPRNLMGLVEAWAEVTRVDRAWLLGLSTADNPRYCQVVADDGQLELALGSFSAELALV